jgi:hypothetical protein
MLGYLEKLTLTPEAIGPADVEVLYAAGLDDEAIADAVHVCALFSIYTRLADAMGWNVPSDPAVWAKQAKFLLSHGYEPGKKPRAPASARSGP